MITLGYKNGRVLKLSPGKISNNKVAMKESLSHDDLFFQSLIYNH